MSNKILIIDDEAKIRLILSSLLEDEGYQVTEAVNGHKGLEQVAEFSPDLIILDMKMPEMSGEDVLRELHSSGFSGRIIILTAFGSIPSAVKAIHAGAYDYITKPFDTDDLLLKVRRALEQINLEKELANAKSIIEENYSAAGIVTNNSEMKRLLELIKRAAPSDVPILIQGSSGTGKELFAKAIHQHSTRKNQSFVAVNCGAIPDNLIESELFGYKKGAFSGANTNKKGLFEEADGGTLFLDEIGEMNLEAQVKLLRVTQSGEYMPVGTTQAKQCNVRIIAATNKPLEESIKSGSFREDLYYRINVVNILVPNLADRLDDIPLLVKHFLNKLDSSVQHCSPEVMRLLQCYSWPGNVRELQNVITGAVTLSSETHLKIEDLPERISKFAKPAAIEKAATGSLHEVVSEQKEATEKAIILEALEACNHNQTRASRQLGIGRRTLIRKLQKYGIK